MKDLRREAAWGDGGPERRAIWLELRKRKGGAGNELKRFVEKAGASLLKVFS